MIPMRTSTIFKSRWWALLWAAGFIWFAVDVAGKPSSAATNNESANEAQTDVTGAPVTDDQERKVADALERL